MNITVENKPNCSATLRVEIPAETVKSERKKILRAFTAQAKVQGFRPGKAPRKVIEKRYGSEMTAELTQQLIRQSFDKAIKEHKLKVLNFGEPSPLSENSDGSMSFDTVLSLSPEVQLPEYKGIAIKAPSYEVTPEEIESNLNMLRERMADFSDIEDRSAEMGDIVVIDYSSTLEGKPLEEALGKPAGHLSGGEDYWLKLDDSSFLPGFAAELEGTKAGDSKEITITLDEDFPITDLHGKDIVFDVNIKALKKMVVPEANDEFATKVGGFDTLDALKETIEKEFGAKKQREIDDYKVNQVVEHFNSVVDFELPETLLRQETQNQADELVKNAAESGMNDEQLAAKQQEIFATAGVQARTNLKTNFILQEVAKAEEIKIDDRELVNHLATIAQSKNENPKKFIKNLQRENRIEGIRNSMLVGKAIDFILEHAKVEEISGKAENTDDNE